MNSERKTALIVGLLFLIATASTLLSNLSFGSIYDANYLTLVAANEVPIIIGVLLFLTLAASVIGITIALFPILEKCDDLFVSWWSLFPHYLFPLLTIVFGIKTYKEVNSRGRSE
ncbi:hypothetical protein EU528_06710 [Candidatus Thorarchaeota archaeon]|nr:MAG: hypothetical protein EU528_06710 [Candidatus Thorarchaeota archaeon]